jgi:hypothetical protein
MRHIIIHSVTNSQFLYKQDTFSAADYHLHKILHMVLVYVFVYNSNYSMAPPTTLHSEAVFYSKIFDPSGLHFVPIGLSAVKDLWEPPTMQGEWRSCVRLFKCLRLPWYLVSRA